MAITLEDHLQQQAASDLAAVIVAVSRAAVSIEQRIRSAAFDDVLGSAGEINVQGEVQQKLDVFANDTLMEVLRATPTVAAAVSEEEEAPVTFDGRSSAPYLAIFDPLDGSSNIDVNVNVGTIVSVMPCVGDITASALQPGTSQAAALYVNYGPSTTLVYTTGKGVHSFTLAGSRFLLTQQNLRIPEQGLYYSVNESNLDDFPSPYPEYLAGLRSGSLLGHRYNSRYIGSFIADFHRTLLKGGVFLYPPTEKSPQGKLRLLYEANPLSLIVEQAGGNALDGAGRLLDRLPNALHGRTSLVIGGRRETGAFLRMAVPTLA